MTFEQKLTIAEKAAELRRELQAIKNRLYGHNLTGMGAIDWNTRCAQPAHYQVDGRVDPKPVCPNCGQWQHAYTGDCFNDCAKRGFAPFAKGEAK